MTQESTFRMVVIMMAFMTAFTTKLRAQTPASQNSALKYMADTTYVTGKSTVNPIYHTAEDATIKALCDYVLFVHQYDSVNLGLGISGNQYATPVFTTAKTVGSSNITDSTALHKVTIADTLYLPVVANAINADSPLVVGINKKTVRKVPPPTAVAPLSVTWPGNVFSLGTVGVANGGTGITSYSAAGAIPYATGAYSMGVLPVGSAGEVLAVSPSTALPVWLPLSSISVTSVSATGTGVNVVVTNPTTTPLIAITLPTVNAAPGSYGSASVTCTFSVTATGLVNTVTATPISIPYTAVIGISPAYVSTVAVNAAPGGYGTTSSVATYTVNAVGQNTASATVPISIQANQINNASSTLWELGGQSVSTVTAATFGTTTNAGINTKINNIIMDSLTSIGEMCFVNSGSEIVASFGNATNNSGIPGTPQQANKILIGVGQGGQYVGNTPFIAFGTGPTSPSISSSGFGNWSYVPIGNGSSATIITGIRPANGSTGYSIGIGGVGSYGGGGDLANTSGTATLFAIGINAATNGYFSPTSGTCNYYACGDQTVYVQSVSATGISASFTNANATFTSATNYRGFYATNTIGYAFYSTSAPSYFGGNIAYNAPTTSTTTDSILVMEGGIVKKTSILNANSVQPSIPTVSAGANYTITGGGQFVELPTATANNNLVLPAATTGMGLIVVNKNTSGTFQWTFTNGTVKDLTNTTVTTMVNATSYRLIYDGTNWQQY